MIILGASLSYLDLLKKHSHNDKSSIWIICSLIVAALVLLVAVAATWSYFSRNKSRGKILFY